MSKPIAVAFADLHLHKFSRFNEGKFSRLGWSHKALTHIAIRASELNVPLLFAGDFIHTPKEVENEVITAAYRGLRSISMVDIYAISGNHDMSQKNGQDNWSPSYLHGFTVFPHFKLMDFRQKKIGDTINLVGIPYLDNDAELYDLIKVMGKANKKGKRKNILMIHTDLPGAKTPAGFEPKEYHALNTDLEKLFKHWDLVLVGHIHKPQRIGKKIIMLGSPIHQIASDEGTEMGYWIIYDDKEEFVPLTGYPKFITLKQGETPKEDINYYITKPPALLVNKDSEKKEFSMDKSKKKLAVAYLNREKVKSKSKRKALIKVLKHDK